MNYWATQSDLYNRTREQRIRNYLDKDKNGSIDVDALTLVLDGAYGECVAYVAPLFGATTIAAWTSTTCPRLLRRCYIDIGVYLAATGSNNVSQTAQLMYDNAVEILEQIRDGKLTLYDEVNNAILTPSTEDYGSVEVYPNDTNRVFTAEGFGSMPSQTRPNVFARADDDDNDPETSD